MAEWRDVHDLPRALEHLAFSLASLCRHLMRTNQGAHGYMVDKTVWPLLQALPTTLQAHPKLAPLREHTLAHFRARIALPLAPPSDQRRYANIQCSCEDCQALNYFLKSPTRASWSYAVNQARRTHLERKVEEYGCDVRYHPLHQGRPHSLVFEKNHGKLSDPVPKAAGGCEGGNGDPGLRGARE